MQWKVYSASASNSAPKAVSVVGSFSTSWPLLGWARPMKLAKLTNWDCGDSVVLFAHLESVFYDRCIYLSTLEGWPL